MKAYFQIIAPLVIIIGLFTNSSAQQKSVFQLQEKLRVAANPNLIFEETFEGTTAFNGIHKQFSETHSFRIVKDTVFRGKGAGRFEVRQTDDLATKTGKRAEVLFPRTTEKERWYSFSIYFPAYGYKIDDDNEVVTQWYTCCGTSTLTLRVEKDKLYFRIGHDRTIGVSKWTSFDFGKVPKDQWNEFIFHIIHSDNSDGLVEIWKNGQKVVNHKGPNLEKGANLPEWKIGIYKNIWSKETTDVDLRVAFFDNVRIGNKNATLVDMKSPELPTRPNLISPAKLDQNVLESTLFKWSNSINNKEYQIQISENENFNNLILNKEKISKSEFNVNGLNSNKKYYWRVRASNSEGTSNWSEIWSFFTGNQLELPAIPVPISPTSGSEELNITLNLEWESSEGATSYRVQVSKEPTFINKQFDLYNLPSTKTEIRNLEKGVLYYWRVAASNEKGNSGFSESWTFKTNSSSNLIKVTSITISPTNAFLKILESIQLTTNIFPENASNRNVTWTTSDQKIATVNSNGLVSGIKTGTVLITATTQDGNFSASAQITVNPQNPPISIVDFTLVNSNSNEDMMKLLDGTRLDINQIQGLNLNIRANTNPETVGSVFIQLTGPVSESITENVAPYALFGDTRGNYNGKILTEGDYTLEAIPYSEPDLKGTKGSSQKIQFSIGKMDLIPTTPKLGSPTNNSTGLPTSIKLFWATVSNADSYTVEVSKNSDFNSLVASSKALKSNEYNLTGLQEDTFYFWRVRSSNSAGNSPYSTVWTFKTIAAPAIPLHLSPSNGAKDIPTSPSLMWNSVTGAKTYRVQISRERNFTTIFLDNGGVTSNSIQVNNLLEGVTYYWRVSASNEAGHSNFSSSWSFSTKTNTIPVSGISISPATASLGVSKSLQLSASVSPLTASNKTVSWSSLDPNIATVNATGLVTGIKAGTTRVTAKSQDGNFTASSQITVTTVNPTIGIAGFTLVNADSDMDITSLKEGDLLDLSLLQGINLNIRANANPSIVGSVSLQLTGPVNSTITENVAPYTLFGDQDGDYNGAKLEVGEYTLEAVPYSELNLGGKKGNSLKIKFEIEEKVVVPSSPKLISPTDKSTGLPNTVKLTWETISNADTYRLEVSKNQNFSSLVINNSSLKTNEFTVSGLEQDTPYYWRVRASNSAGNSSYSTVWTFRTIKPVLIPAVPSLISPSNGAKEISISPSLSWTSVIGAKTYTVQISNENNFENLIINSSAVTANSLQVNDLKDGLTYYWRVRATNEAGNSAFSTVWRFQTKISVNHPPIPVLSSPSDNSISLPTTLKLTWSATTDTDNYGIEISKNPDFSSSVINTNNLKTNEYTVSGLQEETLYFWRVKAANSIGTSDWSAVWSFTTREKINPPSTPILLTPINESIGLTGKTTFTWTKSEVALFYGIQIAKDPSFSVKDLDLQNLQTESFETNNLEKGVTYYWRVYASNEGGNSEYSEIWKLQTLGIPDVPVLQSPSNAKKEVEINPKLIWKSVLGVDSYRIQVSKSKDFSQNIVDNSSLTETFFNVQNLEEGRIYYWRVRATNLAGNSVYSPIWEFTTEKPIKAPATPVLVGPTSGALLGMENILLEWKPVADAEKYQVQVSKYSNFSQAIVFDNNGITNHTVMVDGLDPNQVYFWRVRAINVVGRSGYSTVWNFVTKPLPSLDSPVLKSPVKDAVIDTISLAFLWESVAEAENYLLEVSTDITFKTNVKHFPKIAETTFRLDSLERDKAYFWRVTANGKRPSAQSETRHFKIEKDKVLIQARFSPLNIKAYPNPFNDFIHLEFSKPIEGDVRISIFDSKGITVFESKIENIKERITLEINKGLTDGIYVIKVQGFGVLESKRMVKN